MEIDLSSLQIPLLSTPLVEIPFIIDKHENFLLDLSSTTITLPADFALSLSAEFNISYSNLLAIENTPERKFKLKRKITIIF